MKRYGLTLFAGVKSTKGAAAYKSWPELVQMLEHPVQATSKEAVGLWSPALFDGSRKTENVVSLDFLCLDFDTGVDPNDFVDDWADRGLAFIVHSTFSSTLEHPKWRAVFPLEEPIKPDAWRAFFECASLSLGHGLADPACSDASRMFYMSSCPEGNDDQYFFWHNAGASLPLTGWSEPAATTQEMTGEKPGEAFERKASWESILTPHGWKVDSVRGSLTYWTRPGKKDGISARTGVGVEGDRFYCWSSSVEGVPLRKLLTKFALYAYLNHRGDFKAGTKALAAKGYGDSKPKRAERIEAPLDTSEWPFDPSELGVAKLIWGDHKDDYRWVERWGTWMVWSGVRWVPDDIGGGLSFGAIEKAIDTLLTFGFKHAREDVRTAALKWANKLKSRSTAMNVLDLFKRLPGIGVQTTTFDDPMRTSLLINFPNGTFDLEKGEFRGHRKTDFITSVLPANYNAEADCPLWVKFLGEVQEEDEEKLRFLWKAIGYSLTAATSEKCFFFCYGAGGDNGKSVFTEVLQHVLGSPEKGGYSLAARTESFMTKPSGADGVGDDIAAMRGSRAVFAPETKDGRAIDAQLMKLLTGGDTISARHLYGKPFNFVFGAKIWITGNHAPVVRDNGDAFWRRCRLIPWPVRISPERQDKGLSKKLVAEAEGILAWAIEGAKAWKTEGLGYPDSIRQAVQEYREDNDVLGKFLSECTMSRSGARTSPTELFERYESWCRHRNEKAMTMTAFGRRLAERNLTKSRRGDGRFYEDLDLVPEGETGGGPNPKPWAGLE